MISFKKRRARRRASSRAKGKSTTSYRSGAGTNQRGSPTTSSSSSKSSSKSSSSGGSNRTYHESKEYQNLGLGKTNKSEGTIQAPIPNMLTGGATAEPDQKQFQAIPNTIEAQPEKTFKEKVKEFYESPEMQMIQTLPIGGVGKGLIDDVALNLGGKTTLGTRTLNFIKGLWKPTTGQAGAISTATSNTIAKAVGNMGKTFMAVWLVKEAVESYAQAGWAQKETYDPLQTYIVKTLEENVPDENMKIELIKERAEILAELDDPPMWAKIAQSLPIVNAIYWSSKATETAVWGAKVGSARLYDEATAIEQGVPVEQVAREKEAMDWDEYHQRKIEREKEFILWEEEQKDRDMMEDIAARGEAEAINRQHAAAFWSNHKEDMFKLEEEERERIAKFWLEYKKQLLKLQAESGGSRLNFGLFR